MIPREGLCEQIQASAAKIVMVKAGSGYGKTVGMAFYANKHADICAWYNLEATDDDFMTFIGYLTESIKVVAPDFSFEWTTYSHMISETRKVEIVGYDFVAALNNLHQDICIIMDDFQVISRDDIFGFLNILLEYTEEHVQFVMITNSEFPEQMTKIYLSGRMEVIDNETLMLSCEEIEEKLKKCGNLLDVEECARIIHDYSEGLAICVMSVMLQINQERGTVDKNNIKNYCQQNNAVDYVMMNVYKKLPYDIQQFLSTTCLFDELSVGLCNSVLGIEDSKSYLEYFVSNNLFVVKIRGESEVYRYHSIFKKYLQSTLLEDARNHLLERGARYYLFHKDYLSAVVYGITCNNFIIVQDAVAGMDVQWFIGQGESRSSEIIEFLEKYRPLWNVETKLIVATCKFMQDDYEQASLLLEEILSQKEIRENILKDAMGILKVIQISQANLKDLQLFIENRINQLQTKYSYSWYLYQLSLGEILLCRCEYAEAKNTFIELIEATASKVSGKRFDEVMRFKTESSMVLNHDSKSISTNVDSTIIKSYLAWNDFEHTFINYEDDELKINDVLERIIDFSEYDNTFSQYAKYVISYIQWVNQGMTEFNRSFFEVEKYINRAEIPLPELKGDNRDKFGKPSETNIEREMQEINKKPILHINCFGKFEISYQNEKITFRTKKAKELVAYLVDRYGTGVTKEMIIDALWADEDLDASTLFYTSLSYARAAFKKAGLTDVIGRKNKAYFINVKEIESDYHRCSEIGTDLLNGKISLPEFEHFGEEYMSDIDSLWVVPHREYCSKSYKNQCLEVAEYYEQEQNWDKSAIVLNAAFAKNVYSEDVVLRLIQAYVCNGDFEKAKDVEKKYRKTIKKGMNLEPSEEFVEKYKKLVN